jgi:4-amino-4-deoxy-L-arabinose transferase-like glycosyltransferase
MPLKGTLDLDIWKIWSYAGATNPIGYVYRLQGDERPPLIPAYVKRVFTGETAPAKWVYGPRGNYVDYPPVTPIVFALIGRGYLVLSPEFEDTPTLTFLLKVPGVLADLAATILIFAAASRLYSRRFGLLASALYWLNPMVLLAGPLLAYTDPVYAAFLIASVLLFSSARHAGGWVLYVLAILTKPQSVYALPLFAMASLARRSWRKLMGYVAAAVATMLAVLLPFFVSSTVINLLANNWRVFRQSFLSANNPNLWWLASYGYEARAAALAGATTSQAAQTQVEILQMPDLIAQGLPDPRPWSIAFFAVFTLVVCAVWWIRAGSTPDSRAGVSPLLAEGAALQIFGGTMLLTQAHENHAYGAAALLAVAWWLQEKPTGSPDYALLVLYGALCASIFLTLLTFYGLGEDIGTNVVVRSATGIDLSVLIAAANLAILGAWLYRWIRPIPVFSRGRASVRLGEGSAPALD